MLVVPYNQQLPGPGIFAMASPERQPSRVFRGVKRDTKTQWSQTMSCLSAAGFGFLAQVKESETCTYE